MIVSHAWGPRPQSHTARARLWRLGAGFGGEGGLWNACLVVVSSCKVPVLSVLVFSYAVVGVRCRAGAAVKDQR